MSSPFPVLVTGGAGYIGSHAVLALRDRGTPVAVIDKNVDRKGTRAVAEEYLKYLYTEEGQDIAGKNFYRPAVSEKAKTKYAKQFAKIKLFTIDEAFGGWEKADKEHFADGGSFDQIYTKK